MPIDEYTKKKKRVFVFIYGDAKHVCMWVKFGVRIYIKINCTGPFWGDKPEWSTFLDCRINFEWFTLERPQKLLFLHRPVSGRSFAPNPLPIKIVLSE